VPEADPLRVLVVEDHEDSAHALRDLLQVYGCVAEVSLDGAAAVERCAAFRPDLVLLDLGLPDLTGYEVARQLRSGRLPPEALLVALSGFGEEEVRLREAGFDRHLLKPVTGEILQALLHAVARGTALAPR
jgi:CheY-like chemotaxis protein